MIRTLVLVSLAAFIAVPGTWSNGRSQTNNPPSKTQKTSEEKAFERAERYFRSNNWRRAIEGYEKALPAYNQDSGIFYRLVVACSTEGELRKAVLYGHGFNILSPAHEFSDRLNAMVKKAEKNLRRARFSAVPVTFNIEPKGTEITLNHVPIGESFKGPLNLYAGKYTLRGSYYGHHLFKKVFEVKDQPLTVRGSLEKVITYGKLEIKTQPAEGITVYVDRKKVGVTPIKPLKLRSGRHYVRFEKEGFDRWHRYVTIENDGVHLLEPVMERTPPGKSPFRME